jgi:putative ABC transport system substrate-binding protein
MGRRSITVSAGSDDDLDRSFSSLVKTKIAALVVENDPFFDSRRDHLIALSEQHSIPAIYHIREFPAAGGLMSYGSSLVNAYYQMGIAAGRILKGARVEDLPVVRPTQFELVINLRTAKRLGLTVPPAPIAIADEVALFSRCRCGLVPRIRVVCGASC